MPAFSGWIEPRTVATAASLLQSCCVQCGESLLGRNESAAHPAVIQMQKALLEAKREGVIEFNGLSSFTGKEIVALRTYDATLMDLIYVRRTALNLQRL